MSYSLDDYVAMIADPRRTGPSRVGHGDTDLTCLDGTSYAVS